MRNLEMDMEVEIDPRDMETMSMATCLNRIMIKVRRQKYSDETSEALKNDFAYVGEKFGICPEEAALLSFVLEKSNDFCRCDDGDLASRKHSYKVQHIFRCRL